MISWAAALAAASLFAEAERVAKTIVLDVMWAEALCKLVTWLYSSGKNVEASSIAQKSWKQAATRDEAWLLLPLVAPLVALDNVLSSEVLEGVAWIDTFLQLVE